MIRTATVLLAFGSQVLLLFIVSVGCGSSDTTASQDADSSLPGTGGSPGADGSSAGSGGSSTAGNGNNGTDGSSAGSGGSSTAGNNGGGGTTDRADAATGDANGCPAEQPRLITPCSGSLTCSYGQATCCGITSSFFTCKCQNGSFSCYQTVECNFVCPDASSRDAQ